MLNMDKLIEAGFTIEIQPGVSVRLTSPGGQINIGRANTVGDAILNAMQQMIVKLEEYLVRAEQYFERAEEALHRRGEVVNLLDHNEVERMKKRFDIRQESNNKRASE